MRANGNGHANGSEKRQGDGGPAAVTIDNIRRHIVEHGLQPGDRVLTEREMIRTLGVSRSVVREALRELQAQCVVDARRGHGVFVAPYGPELATEALDPEQDVRQVLRYLFEARAAIEEAAAGYACERATQADLTALTKTVADMDEAARTATLRRDLDLTFHKLLVRSAHNPYLLRISAIIGEQFTTKELVPRATDPRGEMVAIADDHRELLWLLRLRRPTDLSAAVRFHVLRPLWAALSPEETTQTKQEMEQ